MRLTRAGAIAATAVLALGFSSAPAHAQTRSVQRGTDGCFAWSWEKDWTVYASVYFHNRCDRAERIKVAWKYSGYEAFEQVVPADGKDSVNRMSDPVSIWDNGPA